MLMAMLLLLLVHCSLFVFRLVFFHGPPRLEQKEEEFVVYEPYCANYTNASELMLMEEQNLVVRLIFYSPRSASCVSWETGRPAGRIGGNCRDAN